MIDRVRAPAGIIILVFRLVLERISEEPQVSCQVIFGMRNLEISVRNPGAADEFIVPIRGAQAAGIACRDDSFLSQESSFDALTASNINSLIFLRA